MPDAGDGLRGAWRKQSNIFCSLHPLGTEHEYMAQLHFEKNYSLCLIIKTAKGPVSLWSHGTCTCFALGTTPACKWCLKYVLLLSLPACPGWSRSLQPLCAFSPSSLLSISAQEVSNTPITSNLSVWLGLMDVTLSPSTSVCCRNNHAVFVD